MSDQFPASEIFRRLIMCKGADVFSKLQTARVIVVGVGAVGGFALETLARCGILSFVLIDFDTVEISNINRQIVATTKTIGEYKVDIAERRIREINPAISVQVFRERINGARFEEVAAAFRPTMVIDAIDQFMQKTEIVAYCVRNSIPIVSSMGAARKNDPSFIGLSTIWETAVCPLARKVRRNLIDNYNILKGPLTTCVCSSEPPVPHPKDENGRKLSLPSFAVITTIFGVWCAHAAMHYIMYGRFPKKLPMKPRRSAKLRRASEPSSKKAVE